MKTLIWIAAGLALVAGAAHAQGDHYVDGYTRANGTYVAPHYQTNPNATRDDNYSTRGNVNPYTNEPGTKPGGPNVGYQAPQYNPYPTPNYSQPLCPKVHNCVRPALLGAV